MKKTIFFALFLSSLLFGCKKTDKKCDLNVANFAGSYKITAIKYKASATATEQDLFASEPACSKDDIIIFNANFTTTVVDAGVKCVPPGDDTGTWSLAGSTINLDGENGTVSSFDCNSATITLVGTSQGEVTTISLAKQ